MASSLLPMYSSWFGLSVGKPLKIDAATSLGSRPSLARVLVELNITKPYSNKVWLGSKKLGSANLPLPVKPIVEDSVNLVVSVNPVVPFVLVPEVQGLCCDVDILEEDATVLFPVNELGYLVPTSPNPLSVILLNIVISIDEVPCVAVEDSGDSGIPNELPPGSRLSCSSVNLIGDRLVTPSSVVSVGSGVAPIFISPNTPFITGHFVEVHVSFISPKALVTQMGSANSEEDVRMQLDWHQCSSDSSSEASGDDEPMAYFPLKNDRPVVLISSRGRGKCGRK
ncbi:hypothetical protein MA16_Dca004319 [Dendrobium catenatum]|uniref:Uncharacterized protein n=1 Tax=Dendrobium catenatum TaxID=906689 RepID=A0A2I0W736_9ASPA|nr:hypothetical protein MA16_Dca004319 [Dendrobium catenatum]